MKKVILITIVGIFCLIPMKALAWNYADTYPYRFEQKSPDVCLSDPWGFCKGFCTSYAAWKIREQGIIFSNDMSGPNGFAGLFGNAETWDDHARDIGFLVDQNPTAWSTPVWDNNHVAFVERVNSNGTTYISEYNNPAGSLSYFERDSITANSYIHFNGAGCGGTNVVRSNFNVQGSLDCRVYGSLTINPDSTLNPNGGQIILSII